MSIPLFASRRKTAIAVAILLVLAIPVPHQIVPAWSLRVIDRSGAAVGNVPITQTWRHLVYQPQMQAETRRPDADGRLTFPERTTWGSGLRFLYGLVANIARDGTDAAFGPDVWVYAKKNADFGGGNFYTIGQAPPDTLVIRRYGVCSTFHAAAAPAGAGQLTDLAAPRAEAPPAPGSGKP